MTQRSQDAPSTPTGAGSGDGGKSIVSKNFSIVGDLTCQDVLHIDGSVEGNIECQKLTVSEGGRIKGDIRADTVDMHGTLTGAIDARVLTLNKSSNVVGDIVVHETLGIEPGANFDGNCKKLSATDNSTVDDGPVGEDAVGATNMEAAEPDAPISVAPAPEVSMADAVTSDTGKAKSPDESDMSSAAKTDAMEMPVENLSSALDKVAAELKASVSYTAPDKAAAKPVAEPAKKAASPAKDAPDPGAATSLPDPSEPAEKFTEVMTKPAMNSGATPAAAPAKPSTPPAAAKPVAAPTAAAPEPAKSATASNGAAPTD